MYSFINIYDTFKDIATRHSQINTFGFGDIWEIASSGTVDYPMMFVTPEGATAGKGEVGQKYKILVMDKVASGEANELDVLNDTQLILLDVIADLKNHSRPGAMRKDERVQMEDFTERFTDRVAGWSADVVLWVNWDSSRCDIPGNALVIVGQSSSPAVYLAIANNLSDVPNVATARSNLGVVDNNRGVTQDYIAASGTDTYTGGVAPAPAAYATGQGFKIKFTNANVSTTPTFNLNSLGAKAIVKNGAEALVANDIKAGGIYWLIYDGTNFQISGGGSGAGGVSYRNIWIDAASMTPRVTNGAGGATEEYATNDIMMDYFLFDYATEEGVQFKINLPDEWDLGNIKAKFYWDVVTGGTVGHTLSWGIKAGALSNDNAIDAALGSEVTVSDTILAVGDLHVTAATAAVTVGGSPALEDMIVFQVVRKVSGTSVTDVKLLGVSIQYKELTTTSVIW